MMISARCLVVATVLGLGCAAKEPETRPSEPFKFAGIGQEPGWLLEIDSTYTIRFSYDYAQRSVRVEAGAPTLDSAGARVWHVKTDTTDLQVVVTTAPCEDVMSGKPYPSTVTVTLNGQVYRGCGGQGATGSPPGRTP